MSVAKSNVSLAIDISDGSQHIAHVDRALGEELVIIVYPEEDDQMFMYEIELYVPPGPFWTWWKLTLLVIGIVCLFSCFFCCTMCGGIFLQIRNQNGH